MTFWHGGPTIVGDRLLPPTTTGTSRSGGPDSWVYVTPERDLAAMYGATCNGWVYEVEPAGAVEQDPDSMLRPGVSLRCREARIIRRWRLSRNECRIRTAAVQRSSVALQ